MGLHCSKVGRGVNKVYFCTGLVGVTSVCVCDQCVCVVAGGGQWIVDFDCCKEHLGDRF